LSIIPGAIVLADDTALWSIGGLPQLQRLCLVLNEVIDPLTPTSGRKASIVVLWCREVPPCIESMPTHPHLAGVDIIHVDARRSTLGELRIDRGTVLVLRSSVVLASGALGKLLRDGAGGRSSQVLLVDTDTLTSPPLQPTADAWGALDRLLGHASVDPAEEETRSGHVGVLRSRCDIKTFERRLLALARKESDGLVARYFNRRVSSFLSRYLLKTPVTPSQWTFLLLALSFLLAWSISTGTYVGFLMGTLLYQVVSVLDGCDGEIARVKFMVSRFGEWADSLSDQLSHHLFVLALGLGLTRRANVGSFIASPYLWEAIFCSLAMALTLWGVILYTRSRSGAAHFNDFGESLVAETNLSGKAASTLVFLAQLLRRDSYALFFILLAAFDLSQWILHLLTIGVLGHLAALGFSSLRWWRVASVTR